MGMREQGKAKIVTWPAPEEINEKFEAYCMAVGKAAYAWNTLHESLGQLFAALSEDRDAAGAEWYSRPYSDDRQRKMLKKFLAGTPDEIGSSLPRLKTDGLWLLDQADKLADDRNNAVYTPATLYVGDGPSVMGPAFMYGHPRAKNLRGKSLLDEFGWCETCTDILTRFARESLNGYGFPDHFDWPQRPTLPPKPKEIET